MLTEATRKVWTSIIISKIQHASRQFHTMNEAQHGYKRNRGTDSASLVFINLVESAEASKDTSHRTSYDMSRAFDAVSKNVQAIAWRRLGVPDDIADWLVDMDVAGVTVVRSPFSQARWEEDAYMSIRSFSIPPSTAKTHMVYAIDAVQPFTCDRGTGQGNTDSPTCWNAVFDIALTALSLDAQLRGTEHFATGTNGNSIRSSEIGYADDLVSIHGLASEIQRKAEIMSAFCLICGVSLSYKKLRRAVQQWIGPTKQEHHIPRKI
jgi:hypothetical protein